MPLHALSDLSNVDSTASPTISGLTITNNLSVYNQIYAPNQTATLSSSVMTQYAADKRYGNMFVNILSADGPPIDNNAMGYADILSACPLYLALSTGVYIIDSLCYGNNLNSTTATGLKMSIITTNVNCTTSVTDANIIVTGIKQPTTAPIGSTWATAALGGTIININTTSLTPISGVNGNTFSDTAALNGGRMFLHQTTIFVNTPCRFYILYFQNTLTVGNPVTMYKGSWMIATQVG